MAFINPADRYGFDFIPAEYLPAGKDEYWIRNTQVRSKAWRKLKDKEREILIANNNICPDWNTFLVSDPFDPQLIRHSYFYGLVRIGALRNVLLQHHDFNIPAGIRNSTIISCDIGDDVAIQDCSYISHYIIGDACILSRIDELQTTNHSKFGNGAIKDGEKEDVRIWIDVMNEAGGRSILPFDKMLSADAFLWACYRDDTELCEKLKNITQKEYGGALGTYGVVGSHSTIKSCNIIKDVFVGEWAYIKGANKLKNISVLSSKDERTQIGEGVEMVNGILGYGCRAFYGVKAVRFVMGRGSSLKYGARLIHSVLGDNSTVSCCELLNNLIFPGLEQHHNNSFLIASLIQGMSNIAAGATIGSNHNSRANDGEIRAGRGFWVGLSTSLKHSCRFASFILLAKGDYPYELNISLPFSLVTNNQQLDRLEVMPAYFWMYNIYALERNSWKIAVRDRRKVKKQRIEADYLAPDTAEEIISAISQIEHWIRDSGESAGRYEGVITAANNEDPEHLLQIEGETFCAGALERSHRKVVVLKPRRALTAYRDMLIIYSLKTLVDYLNERHELSYADFVNEIETAPENENRRVSEWINLGGQIVPAFRVDSLRGKIRRGEIDSWDDIHASYDEMAAAYPLDKARHAWEVYRIVRNGEASGTHPLLSAECFVKELEKLLALRQFIAEQVYKSRAKDFGDPFRAITFRNKEEMEQVAGTAGNDSFIKLVKEQTKLYDEIVKKLSARLHSIV